MLFDYIFKDVMGSESYPEQYGALKKFESYNYDQVRDIYPQVHLFKRLDVPEKYHQEFDKELKQEKDDFSLVNYFKFDANTIPDIPLISRNQLNDEHEKEEMKKVLNHVKQMYNFIASKENITHLKLRPMEVTYPSNKYGLPLHIIQRDKLLKDKLIYVKSVVNRYKPIPASILDQLGQITNGDINPHFFTYMIQKRRKVIVKIKGNKKFIPDSKNIVKIYREYLSKQFYYDPNTGKYETSSVMFYQ
ncbi:hypothetical protein PSN45_004949 [Yamadazyma tenuis]|nr:hypothetical protein PSN45_004949 [Yamadazyma tenuis]